MDFKEFCKKELVDLLKLLDDYNKDIEYYDENFYNENFPDNYYEDLLLQVYNVQMNILFLNGLLEKYSRRECSRNY